jgi:hypothetical protein
VNSTEEFGKDSETPNMSEQSYAIEKVAMRFVRDIQFPHAQFACVCRETFEVDHKHLTASATDNSMVDLVMQCDHCGNIFSTDLLRKLYREADPRATFME